MNDVQTLFYTKTRSFGTRFREKVITIPVLTQNDGKRLLHQKRRFGMRFREKVQNLLVLSKIDLETHFTVKTLFWH